MGTERAATLIQEPTASEATLEMMVIFEIVIVVMVIELSELSKQLLKEDTIRPMITCFKMCNKCNTDFLLRLLIFHNNNNYNSNSNNCAQFMKECHGVLGFW